jgi:hypothetical protein
MLSWGQCQMSARGAFRVEQLPGAACGSIAGLPDRGDIPVSQPKPPAEIRQRVAHLYARFRLQRIFQNVPDLGLHAPAIDGGPHAQGSVYLVRYTAKMADHMIASGQRAKNGSRPRASAAPRPRFLSPYHCHSLRCGAAGARRPARPSHR